MVARPAATAAMPLLAIDIRAIRFPPKCLMPARLVPASRSPGPARQCREQASRPTETVIGQQGDKVLCGMRRLGISGAREGAQKLSRLGACYLSGLSRLAKWRDWHATPHWGPDRPDGRSGSRLQRVAGTRKGATSTIRQVDCQAALAGLFVFLIHVAASIAHGGNAVIERHEVLAIAA